MNTKNFFIFLLLIIFNSVVFSQQNMPYNPQANAQKQLDSAITIAQKTGKHIFVQIGGNWCPWCLKLHDFYTQDKQIDSIMKANYVVVLINYSRENKNLDILEQLGYPQRFGFPVIVILDSNGSRLHTQNTEYLEENQSYSRKRFIEFLKHWDKNSLNPENYKK